jgi:acyl-CoA synthetase (AMP-forming)/AMP-acid ligase II
MQLYERFHDVAGRHTNKTAIVHEQEEVSYASLSSRTQALCRFLSRSAGTGAVIGLCVHAPTSFVTCYLASEGAGAKLVLLDPRAMKEHVQGVRHFEITHLMCTERELPELAGLLETAHSVDIAGTKYHVGKVQRALRADRSHYRPEDFVVHCTSGSTGTPKGIVLSSANIVARIDNWSASLALTEDDIVLCSLTLSHCHGIDVLMLPGLFNGCRVVAPDLDRISPRRIAGLFKEHRVTTFSSLPYFYELMVDTVAPERTDLSSLRYMISGSAPLADRTAVRFRERFGKGIQQVYGLSEIGVISLDRDPDHVGSIGELIAGVEGYLTDEGAGDGSGELVVKGPALARGYLDSPHTERTFFRDGWLFTQDLVRRGATGLHIVGRRSRFINSGGNKIDPAEVEQVLQTHPAVAEAVVTSKPDALQGQRVVAYVRASRQVSSGELHDFLSARLALYKLPAELRFVDSIPKSTLGKVQVAALVQADGDDQREEFECIS